MQDKEVPLLENIFLYIRYKKKRLFKGDFTIIINDRQLNNVPFKDLTCVDTGLRKGEFIKDVFICTGSIKVQGYAFQVRGCAEELHLEVREDKITLNGKEPVLKDNNKGCYLM